MRWRRRPRMLVSLLESGEWRVEGNELVDQSGSLAQTMIEMSLGAEREAPGDGDRERRGWDGR